MSLDNFRKRAIVWDTVNKDFPQPIQIMQGDVNARTLSVKIIDNGGEIDLTGHSLKLTYQYTNSSNSGFVMIPPENLTKGEFILVIPTEMTKVGVIEANLILLNEDKEQVIVSKNLTFISNKSTVTDLAQEVNNKIDDFTKLLLENMPQVMRSELNDLHAQTDSNKSNIELKANLADMTSLQSAMTELKNEVEAFGISPENLVTIKSLLDAIARNASESEVVELINSVKVLTSNISLMSNGDYSPKANQRDLESLRSVVNNHSEWKSAIENETTFNLFQPTLRSTSLNGLSLLYNGDGTYTIDGTAKARTNFYLLGSNWTSKTLKAGTYRFVGNPPGGLNSTYYIEVALKNASGISIYDKIDTGSGLDITIKEDATSVYFAITVFAGTTLNSLTFKPMLTENLAATYDNYVKYTGIYTTINQSIAKLNDDISALENNTVYWDMDIKPPYWTLHLDCARKYITVSNVLVIIDKIYEAGFNQLQLHFSDDTGFRLRLNDMTVTDEDGISYDLTPCLGGTDMPKSWYSQSDMDTIISYARGKGIDVVPSFDMPGHMQWILKYFPAFRYESSNTLNIMNITAVKFAKAISDKYSKYFSSRGCHFWNIGYDEIANSNGFKTFYNEGNYDKVISFAKEIIEVVQGNGLTPRIFNEVVYYNSDYRYLFGKDVEVYHWYSPAPCATAKQLQYAGYKLINTNTSWYWVLNRTDMQVSVDTLKTADLLKGYHDSTTDHNGYGAMFCVWCDRPIGYSDEGDGGNALVTSITPLIAAFGIAIKNATT